MSITVSFSQDIICKKTGEKIMVRIITEEKTEIKYQNYDDITGPILSIPRSDVIMIQHKLKGEGRIKTTKRNKTRKDSYKYDSLGESIADIKYKDTNDKIKGKDINHILPSSELFIHGQIDATKYYRGYKEAGTWTLITSLAYPLFGLVPAISCSVTEPKDKNLGFANPDLMKNADYYYGYTLKANQIKRSKIWKNWVIAFGMNLVATVIIIVSEE